MRNRNGWRPSALFSEALRNTISGRWFSLALGVVIAGPTVGALVADAQAVSAIHQTEQRFLSDGGNIVVVEGSDSSGRVDAAACAAMQKSPDVIAAGAVSGRPNGARVVGRPEAMQSIHYATSGFETIAGSKVRLGADQAISSKIIAERWLAAPGSVVGFVPASGRVKTWFLSHSH